MLYPQLPHDLIDGPLITSTSFNARSLLFIGLSRLMMCY